MLPSSTSRASRALSTGASDRRAAGAVRPRRTAAFCSRTSSGQGASRVTTSATPSATQVMRCPSSGPSQAGSLATSFAACPPSVHRWRSASTNASERSRPAASRSVSGRWYSSAAAHSSGSAASTSRPGWRPADASRAAQMTAFGGCGGAPVDAAASLRKAACSCGYRAARSAGQGPLISGPSRPGRRTAADVDQAVRRRVPSGSAREAAANSAAGDAVSTTVSAGGLGWSSSVARSRRSSSGRHRGGAVGPPSCSGLSQPPTSTSASALVTQSAIVQPAGASANCVAPALPYRPPEPWSTVSQAPASGLKRHVSTYRASSAPSATGSCR